MNTSKIIKAYIGAGTYSTTEPMTQGDYGYILQIEGTVLPATYRVDFANDRHEGEALTVYGNENGAEVPEELIATGKDIFAFYYYIEEGFGKTAYTWKIPNDTRANAGDREPTPTQQDSIDQLIVRSNEAVETAEASASAAGQSAQSASDDAGRAERARTAAETAQGKAEDAQESAERAKDDAETSERNASESERKAKGYAETASEKADAITGLTAQATTLPDGSSATASYDAETGVMSFGIPKGKDGTDGDDGYSPTANVSKTGKVATITITDKNGTTSAQVEDGEDGTDGIDGISPSVSVTDITGGHRVVITDKDGTKSFDVEDGATGATPNLTIGTVETLDPTDDATATITGTPENPVLNLGIPQGDTGEVTTEEFLKAFPTDTASGAIASFSDGADNLPLKSLIVDINPVQDLHGQDSPYPAGGGKNKFFISASRNAYSWSDGCGFAAIAADDSSITFNGTASAPHAFSVPGAVLTLPAGTYTVSVSVPGKIQFVLKKSGTQDVIANITDNAARLTLTEETTMDFQFTIQTGASFSNQAIGFQIESGSTATSYAPYENICPISGWTSVDVEQRGKNLFDAANAQYINGYFTGSTPSQIYTGNAFRTVYIPCKPNTTYRMLNKNNSGKRSVGYTTELPRAGVVVYASAFDYITTGADAKYLVCYVFNSATDSATLEQVFDGLQIELGSTATPYSPYTGRSITIDLEQTVYCGHLDVLSGVLTVDRAMVDLGTLDWAYTGEIFYSASAPLFGTNGTALIAYTARNVCEIYKYAVVTINNPVNGCFFVTNTQEVPVLRVSDNRFTDAVSLKSALDGIKAVFKLYTPLTIQLDAHVINSLYGVNNIWADSGDTTAEYRADTKLFIAKKIAEAISALS